MEVLRSFVVRIYRQEASDVAGVIESVETGTVAPFRTSSELWSALRSTFSRVPGSSTNHQEENEP
jgi:hypothetical protein